MHFSGGQRFYFFREITYPPGVARKHPKTTFQLFRRLRYWEFYKRTKTLRIRAYGSLRYVVPKNVNFSNGNNRFRVIESEVNFRRGVNKLLKIAIIISFVETTDGNIVKVCNVCFRSLSAIALSIILWKHETPLVTPKGKQQY